jgi:cytidylate kinase
VATSKRTEKIVAIDGPGGVGKSSVAKQLASRLPGWFYLDTGAMYRAITWAWLEAGASPALLSDKTWIAGMNLRIDGESIDMNGHDISTAIRTREVTAGVSEVSAAPRIRANLTKMQRMIGLRNPCVVDGRDIGTVVFPNAMLKVFLQASPEVRARRRWLQLGGEKTDISIQELVADLQRRDTYDSTRSCAPLKPADDAWILNTDLYDQAGVTDLILKEALNRLEHL